MCCGGMNELSQGMSNVYSGLPRRRQMRAEASPPPPGGEGRCGNVWIELGEPGPFVASTNQINKASRNRILGWFGSGAILDHPVPALAMDRTSDGCRFSWCFEDPIILLKPSLRIAFSSATTHH